VLGACQLTLWTLGGPVTESQDQAVMGQYIVDIAEYAPLSGADELRLPDTIARGRTAEAELEVLGPDSLSSVGEGLRDEVAKRL
jgi:hypothetical protein